MKSTVPAVVSAVIGVAVALAVIIPVTSAIEGTSRPDTGVADASDTQVQYGTR
ncbi:MAG: DUF2613 domain-containing protein [Tomitella sp.]|nr:DUF2613 domain-containing protein [Tomitella sp.]